MLPLVPLLLRSGTRGMLNSPGLTSTSLRCSAALGYACRPENWVEPVEVEDIVEDFLKRGSDSKEVARLTLRFPDMLLVSWEMEPWMDEVSFCAR